ncbi:MAG: hypothetical protein IIB35_08960 [Gemmatimonadetes bacterium]|nr:hypothetical protein [Gemmatimonadota bacterium]
MFAPRNRGPSNAVRRFLADLRASADRRAWQERRVGERRSSVVGVVEDRRDGNRRSGAERRIVLTDRRRRLHDVFSRGDAEQIREMMMDPGVEAACPHCDGNLMLGSVIPHEGGTARNVHCTNCRHSVLLVSAPGKPLELA